MKKKTPKKDKIKFWVEVPTPVANELTEMADLDGRKRKPYIEKLLIKHSGIKAY